MAKKKIKEIKLPMKFNPGASKYEPILPARKADKKLEVPFNWKWIISIILIIAILIGLMIIVSNLHTPWN